jgi:hypothetical protein
MWDLRGLPAEEDAWNGSLQGTWSTSHLIRSDEFCLVLPVRLHVPNQH